MHTNKIPVFSFHVLSEKKNPLQWLVETSQSVAGLLWGGVDWVGGVRWAVSLSKALWVGGPVCFAAPDLQCSHPTARGQSRPRHVREREEDSWLSWRAEQLQIFFFFFEKGCLGFCCWKLVLGLIISTLLFARMLRTCASVRVDKR